MQPLSWINKTRRCYRGVKNYSVAVSEVDDNIIFLRKIVEGGADQSYGIEVAKLAGLPKEVINRAKEILSTLESSSENNSIDVSSIKEVAIDKTEENNPFSSTINAEAELENTTTKKESKKQPIDELNDYQIDFTMIEKDNLIYTIADIDIMALTPMEAMNTLYKLTLEAKKLK